MRKPLLLRKFRPILAALALVSCGRNSPPPNPPPPAKIQGGLIEPVADNGPASNAPPRRKHPLPPSTQRRMVLAEFVQLTQSNSWSGPMPSGTKGSAADLAKTNLPSVTSLAAPGLALPGYAGVTFDTLAGFDFVLTKEMADGTASPADIGREARAQIPPGIQALDGKKVVIQGFLLPVRMNDSLAVEFLLMRNQSMCCYGVAPKINEWITVQAGGRGVKPVMDQPITVAGVLHVGPIEENGSLAGLYRLDADKINTPF